MASKTTQYVNQQKQLDSNLIVWNDFISTLTNVVNDFYVNMNALQELLDNANSEIEFLKSQIENVSASVNSYVKLSSSAISLRSSNNAQYTNTVGVYSNSSVIYVYANRTVGGLLIKTPNSSTYVDVVNNGGKYFTTLLGQENRIKFITNAVQKGSEIKLTFSDSSTAAENSHAAVLTINMVYEQTKFESLKDVKFADLMEVNEFKTKNTYRNIR